MSARVSSRVCAAPWLGPLLWLLWVGCGEPAPHARTPAHKPLAPRVAAPAAPTPLAPVIAEPAPATRTIEDLSIDGLEPLVQRAIARGQLPGCVIAVGDRAGIRVLRAFGQRSAGEPMTIDTRFDLASLTKPMATAASIMSLVEHGRVRLEQPVSELLHELRTPDKQRIRLSMLLLHTSGFPSVNVLDDVEHGVEHAVREIAREPLISAPGSGFHYSDLGFILLGEVVARTSGLSLAQYAEQHLFRPLGMTDTLFAPPLSDAARTAPTEERDERVIRGVVDDPRAYRLGGIAGHAGLFSTAHDVSRFARMLLGEGELDGVRVLASETVRTWMAPRPVGRALGFDAASSYADGKGTLWSARAVGHGGYTGTSLWVDPERDLFVVLLSNRVHVGPAGTIHPLARNIADLSAHAVDRERNQQRSLATGIDVLAAEDFARVRGPALALLTHTAARDRAGRSTLESLSHAKGVNLRKILAPEHGLGSDREGALGNARDAASGLMVHSLFGKQRRPSAELLADIELVVIDLVDVGARFYTYMATALSTIEAAAASQVPVMVLDRPNPIDAVHVEGPVSEPAYASFVNYHPLPLRHGMTAGELLGWLVRERGIAVQLEVVRMQGYRRDMLFTDTGLVWRAPSPNLQRPEQALLYPAVALVEGTNVSVGRGTREAFEVIGAPFIDPNRLGDALRAYELPGLRITSTSFTPRSGPHTGLRVPGVRLEVLAPRSFLAAPLGLALAQSLRALYPGEWDATRLDRMVAHATTLSGLHADEPTSTLISHWERDLEKFARSRNHALMY